MRAKRFVFNKTTGLDCIPLRFVRDGAWIKACPLTHAINLSLIQGVVPDVFFKICMTSTSC